MNMDVKEINNEPRPQQNSRRKTWTILGGTVLGLLIFHLLFGNNFFLFQKTEQLSCQGGFCVQRVTSPDLIIVSGRDDIRLGRQDDQTGRSYVARNPFDSSPIRVTWNAGGVSLTSGVATFTWDAAAMELLND